MILIHGEIENEIRFKLRKKENFKEEQSVANERKKYFK